MENLTFYLSVLRNNDQTIIVFANHTKVINEERGAVDRLRVISKVQPGVQEAVSKCMTQISQCELSILSGHTTTSLSNNGTPSPHLQIVTRTG